MRKSDRITKLISERSRVVSYDDDDNNNTTFDKLKKFLMEDPQYLLKSLSSGLITSSVVFVFNCVFSVMIFSLDESTSKYLPIGIQMHTLSTVIGGIVSVMFSECRGKSLLLSIFLTSPRFVDSFTFNLFIQSRLL